MPFRIIHGIFGREQHAEEVVQLRVAGWEFTVFSCPGDGFGDEAFARGFGGGEGGDEF